jgi:4-diphosphocytidyl-2-C-methyl-D-erythritol kinase
VAELKSYGKINIGLRILGRRPVDGYHLLESIFCEISLHDTLHVEINHSGTFKLQCSQPDIPLDGSNTIAKAWQSIKPYLPTDMGATVFLEKKIPSGAGLGGGSSNAATFLKYLASYSPEKIALPDLALGIGADLPFFLEGGLKHVTGIGEKLAPFSLEIPPYILLVKPPIHISTPWAYKALKIPLTAEKKSPIFTGFPVVWQNRTLFENEFEKVIYPAYPQIGEIKEVLLDSGADFASLSGSGSTVFGIFDNRTAQKNAEERCKGLGQCFSVEPVHRSPSGVV